MFFIKSKHVNFILVLFLSLFLLNCQKNRVIKSHGIIFLEKRESLLKTSVTNKNDVVDILGQPHIKSMKDKNTWLYIERTKTRGSMHKLGQNVLLNNNVLIVKFNKYGIVIIKKTSR